MEGYLVADAESSNCRLRKYYGEPPNFLLDIDFDSFLMENCLTVQADICGGNQYPLQVIIGVLKLSGY